MEADTRGRAQGVGDLEAERKQATATLKRIEAELVNLVALAASSGSVALLDGIKSRERQKADRQTKLGHLDGLALVPNLDRAALRESLREQLDDWRNLLLAEPVLARQILRKVLRGKLDFDAGKETSVGR